MPGGTTEQLRQQEDTDAQKKGGTKAMNLSDTFFTETYYFGGSLPLQVEFGIEDGDVSSCYINDVWIEGKDGHLFGLEDLTKVGEYKRTNHSVLGEWKDLKTLIYDWAVDFYDKWNEDLQSLKNYPTEEDDEEEEER